MLRLYYRFGCEKKQKSQYTGFFNAKSQNVSFFLNDYKVFKKSKKTNKELKNLKVLKYQGIGNRGKCKDIFGIKVAIDLCDRKKEMEV